jgi:hypothetical protein
MVVTNSGLEEDILDVECCLLGETSGCRAFNGMETGNIALNSCNT